MPHAIIMCKILYRICIFVKSVRRNQNKHFGGNMQNTENENMLEGRNAVTEALKAGRTIDKVFLASGDTDSTLRYIASLAKKSGAVVTYCDRRKPGILLGPGYFRPGQGEGRSPSGGHL
jgi:hypothetical protein